ncbi:MAG: hypothetical protein K2X55_28140 [Burkholderiaceae bacterium]|nr:hypothetical protein [Burkholderiaceae bacterium]
MKITITSPVQHDGKELEVGDTVNIADRAAKNLIAAGAAESADKPKAEPTAAPKLEVEPVLSEPAQGQQEQVEQDRQQ